MSDALIGYWIGGFLFCGLLPLWMIWGATRRGWPWMVGLASGVSLLLAIAGSVGSGGELNVGSWFGFVLTLAAAMRYLDRRQRGGAN